MNLKYKPKNQRIQAGNRKADLIRDYLNNRFQLDLKSYENDKKDWNDMIDFGNEKYSFQSKCRDNRDDIINESDKFFPKRTNGILESYDRKLGRDSRSTAEYYVLKPANKNEIAIITTSSIKSIMQSMREEWGYPIKMLEAINGVECPSIVVETEQISRWWLEARNRRSKSAVVFQSQKNAGAQIFFKEEEGDEKLYLKLIFYIPYLLSNHKVVEYLDGEFHENPSTWKTHSNESFESYLPT